MDFDFFKAPAGPDAGSAIHDALSATLAKGEAIATVVDAGDWADLGTIEAYFESNTLYQSVLDHGGGAVSLTAGGTANKKYTFLLPAVKFLDGAVKLGGKNDDVMVSIPFRAIYDATTAGSIKITRAVA